MSIIILLFLTGIVALFLGLYGIKRPLLPVVATALVAGIALCLWQMNNPTDSLLSGMLSFDHYACLFTAGGLTTALLILLLTQNGFSGTSGSLGDYYGLILFSLCGGVCMVAFDNLVMLFLGIEILSIPLYVLAGSRRDDLRSNEAALKYFVMGAFATGFLLFGIALIYGSSKSFDLSTIAQFSQSSGDGSSLFKVGILLMLVGIGFKVSLAPFHFWSPDVYDGSPNLITAFMATVVKLFAFGAFFRLFDTAFEGSYAYWAPLLCILAGLTMLIGNITALQQTNFKRMLAYSSISHAGYMILALVSGHPQAGAALLFYLLAYGVSTVSIFAIFYLVSGDSQDSSFARFNGLGQRRPFLALVMTICMLSLAGIPPTAGFFGKYLLFSFAFEQQPLLVIVALLNSAISIYYYFKVIQAMYFRAAEDSPLTAPPSLAFATVMGIGAAVALIASLLPNYLLGVQGL